MRASVMYLYFIFSQLTRSTRHGTVAAFRSSRHPYVRVSTLFPYEFRLQYVRGMHWAMPAQVQIL